MIIKEKYNWIYSLVSMMASHQIEKDGKIEPDRLYYALQFLTDKITFEDIIIIANVAK